MLILSVNSGSSSLKYRLFEMPQESLVESGGVERIGEEGGVKNHLEAVREVLGKISSKEISAVGHRVVHGGEAFVSSRIITDEVIDIIEEYADLAPLHNPANLMGIMACQEILNGIPQVAVFDTAFFSTLPRKARTYAIPSELSQKYNIRRYGFHGISHNYLMLEAESKLNKPAADVSLITLHLGNGCSAAAIKKGRAVDVSLGFTPLEGLVMGTRSGDIDPSIIFFLSEKVGMPLVKIKRLLNEESGLKGLSGISNDMRDILKAADKGDERAALAIEVFVYRIVKYIGAYIAVLGEVDAVVFTAGIGENQTRIVEKICGSLEGIFEKFDMKVLRIPANEELMIARETYETYKIHKPVN